MTKLEATAEQIRALVRLAEPEAGRDGSRGGARGRGAAERALPSTLLERYQGLVEAGRTPAVVAVERGSCGGCHVRVPTMLEYKITRSLGLYACPRCRRLLYAPELVAESRDLADKKSPGPPEPAAPGRS